MGHRWCLAAPFLLAICLFGNPVSTDRQVTHLAHYTPNAGLSQSSVLTVLQDRRGFLWFGTEDGLNRFDGVEFVKFNARPNDPQALSDNVVLALFEDEGGLLWIGTKQGGLNAFDPETETFRNWPIAHKDTDLQLEIRVIFRTHGQTEETLWIGTRGGGLIHLNVTTGEQVRYEPMPNRTDSLSNEDIWTIATIPGQHNALWLGTSDGLNRLDLKTGRMRRYHRGFGLRQGAVSKILPAREGGLWLGGPSGGLQHFNVEEGRVDWWSNPLPSKSFAINEMAQDRQGHLWVGSSAGVFTFTPADRNWHQITGIGERDSSGDGIAVTSLGWDRAETLWIGTWNGVYHVAPHPPRFGLIQKSDGLSGQGLSGQDVRSFFQDQSGTVWVGTNAGLTRMDEDMKYRSAYGQESNPDSALWGNYVWSLWESGTRPGVLWIGTDRALNKLHFDQGDDPAETRFVNPRNTRAFATGLGNQIVTHLYEAPDLPGTLWVGLARGLATLNLMTEKAALLLFEPGVSRALNLDNVRAILQDSQGYLWLGGNGTGLHRISVSDFRDGPSAKLPFDRFTPQFGDPNSLSHASVSAFLEDRDGALWIGTYGGGLNLFQREKGAFSKVTTEDGLSNNVVHAILEDRDGHLWVSTNSGLNRFHPATGEVRTFDVTDGLQGNEFNSGSGFASKGGILLFGGRDGLNFFKPESIADNPFVPPVLITGFSIHNAPVTPDPSGWGPLKKSIDRADEVILTHRHKFFSFEFSALNFIEPQKNRYAYKMEGLEGDWHQLGHQRQVTFTNLAPGRYTLAVKASNNDGVWNDEGTRLALRVKAPPWATWWAKSLYGLVIAIATITGFRWRVNALHRHKRVLERKVAKRTAKIQQQKSQLEIQNHQLLCQKQKIERQADDLMAVDRAKSRFFANISHEFRTPLTLIQTPLAAALEEEYGPLTQSLNINLKRMRHHAAGLHRLIDQLLDLARLESGNLHLDAANADFLTFAKAVFGSFISLAQQKDIRYQFVCDYDHIEVCFDLRKMESAITNLIANAFKFTPAGGSITVEVQLVNQSLGTGSFAALSVGDTGLGIPEAQLPRIFDRFYQAQDSGPQRSEGCGIGLALVREYVKLHGGTITAGNQPRGGALFQVSLPLGTDHLDPAEIRQKGTGLIPQVDEMAENTERIRGAASIPEPGERPSPGQADKPAVLIVEDHADLRAFLVEQLCGEYRIFTAENGRQGLHQISQNKPDLIICDVMMPEMDGYELVRQLRRMPVFAHIPVILLTALADQQDKLEAFAAQADAFITKPFSSRELKMRVGSLLATRGKIRQSLLHQFQSHREISAHSTGTSFLEPMRLWVLDHLTEPELTVERLANHMAMSKRNLERRLKEATGISAGTWVRNIRLNHARHLLAEGRITTVSEAASASGFQNAAYFSRLYQKAFGQRPRHQLKQRNGPSTKD